MARRRRGRPLSGVLLIDKPKGLSSNQALSKARWLYQAAKGGHTGTLDPMATGLLPVCFGEATKFSSFALESDKRYVARVQLGITTDSGDAEGNILDEQPLPSLDADKISQVLAAFEGDIEQVPPMFSALKHQGRPLYELAREGKEIERAPRRVKLYHVRLVEFDAESGWFDIDVECSKGTYIRTLAMDLGKALGSGAHLTALRRLKSGPFEASGMQTLERLEQEGDNRDSWLLPIDTLIAHLPRLSTGPDFARRLALGQKIPADKDQLKALALTTGDTARLYCDERLLGLVTVTERGGLAPNRLISTA